jgi:hypothetical protein
MTNSMAEKAFYQCNFLRASNAAFGIVEIPLTAFSAHIKTNYGVKLTQYPFAQYQQIISSPISYQSSQLLGTTMRQANVEAVCYQSARIAQEANNVALFTPKAFLHKNPDNHSLQAWQCIADKDRVEFVRSSAITVEAKSFSLDTFLVDGILPFPAV